MELKDKVCRKVNLRKLDAEEVGERSNGRVVAGKLNEPQAGPPRGALVEVPPDLVPQVSCTAPAERLRQVTFVGVLEPAPLHLVANLVEHPTLIVSEADASSILAIVSTSLAATNRSNNVNSGLSFGSPVAR